ncbi:hypothetical protein [Pseudobutyrivibrio ruminis]|uniref:Uncharacterized protein n=1 Tax=Pseudobutyrivibrio ruminis TaxID=46206 RepID=A0A2G3DU47_9FIRM|nr:hypothetical protein [Pseudobutyrivibrio ruminis]PHU34405.1 hypothetical protein CSX01_10105 [Pseudobutyrivibrio ruminis]
MKLSEIYYRIIFTNLFARVIIQTRVEKLVNTEKEFIVLLSALVKRGFLPWLKNKEIKKAVSSDRKQRIKKAVIPYREWEIKNFCEVWNLAFF